MDGGKIQFKEMERSYIRFLKTERLPTSWCPGCGDGNVIQATCQVFDELGFSHKDVVVVSGIGCAGRSAGYIRVDTVHGLHGRALPLAEGITAVRDDLKVVVISGDGDIMGIGGNHLIHTSRRGSRMSVFCVTNDVYGMTGGQKSPITKLGAKTITSPDGNRDRPVDVQGIVLAHQNFYGRTSVYHLKHMKDVIKAALEYDGFSFVEIISHCISNYGRRVGFKSPYEMFVDLKRFKINDGAERLKEDEIGITRICANKGITRICANN